jgi:catechol 2,3-dioxygenase
MVEIYADVEKDWRPMRKGIIIKEKPKWIPGVTSDPLTEKCYPQDPDLVRVKTSVFHPKKVTHVALVAKNFESMVDYYTDIVGLHPLVGDRNSDSIVLRGTASDGDVTIYRSSDDLKPGLHHVGFEVWDEDDLKASIATLPQAGVQLEREVDHPARHSVVIKDPDGLRLQFFVNRNWTAPVIGKVSKEEALYLF